MYTREESSEGYRAQRPEMSQLTWPWSPLIATRHKIFSKCLLREDLWIVKELWQAEGSKDGPHTVLLSARLWGKPWPLASWAFTGLESYRWRPLQWDSSLTYIMWSNAADGSGTALVSASGSQVRTGPFASQKRGKILGWNKRCYFMGSPSKGCLETPQSQKRTLALPITAFVLQWAS